MHSTTTAWSAVTAEFQKLDLWATCTAPLDAHLGPSSAAWQPMLALLATARSPQVRTASINQLITHLEQTAKQIPRTMDPQAQTDTRAFIAALLRHLREGAPPARTGWWTVLQVEQSASRTAIKAAYRKRRSETHPDHCGNADEFRLVELAYQAATA